MTAYRQDAEQAISLSYADMYSRVAEIAAGLTKLGVVRGDVVSFQLPNWWQFLPACGLVQSAIH
jgi:cyclohexanecarboxylate-CoA ligase